MMQATPEPELVPSVAARRATLVVKRESGVVRVEAAGGAAHCTALPHDAVPGDGVDGFADGDIDMGAVDDE